MIMLLRYLFIFAAGAFAGWCIELFFRRFVSQKHWVNPGFLNGPYLPLYGFGTTVLYLFSLLVLPFWLKVLIIILSMTLLELIAGVIFLKYYHIKLWDYSDQWLNYKGLICPLFSLFWGILGVLFTVFIYPPLAERVDFLMNHLELSFFIGAYYGIFFVDVISSLGVAEQIRQTLKEVEAKFHINYEHMKEDVLEWIKENAPRSNKNRFMVPFRGRGRSGIRELILLEAERRKKELELKAEKLTEPLKRVAERIELSLKEKQKKEDGKIDE